MSLYHPAFKEDCYSSATGLHMYCSIRLVIAGLFTQLAVANDKIYGSISEIIGDGQSAIPVRGPSLIQVSFFVLRGKNKSFNKKYFTTVY